MYLLRKISCILLVLNLAACGGSSGSDSSTPVAPTPTPVTPSPTPVTPPTITPTYNGVTGKAEIDISSVKPLILDVIYALDTANILIFGAEKSNQLLRPENDFKNFNFSQDNECSSGSQDIDFREFEEKIKNGETVDIVGQIFVVTYSQCTIGNFILSGTAELLVKEFDNDSFNLTSFNLYTDKTLELKIDSNNYQLQGTVYSENEKNFTLDVLLTTSNESQNIYLSNLLVEDLSEQLNIDKRLQYSGEVYFSRLGKVTISSSSTEELYTFSGKNEHKLIFDFSDLNLRSADNLGFVNLELITNYYNYPTLNYYLGGLKKELFLARSNMNAFKAPDIFQFIFPLNTELKVTPEDPPLISDFIKQEWQLTRAPNGVDKSINYGPKVTYQLTHYGDYTLKHIITNSTGDEKTFFKGFSVPKPNNINATIQVETPNWQLGNAFQAKVVSESTSDFTASLAFGPSGMTVTEEGNIVWDGNFFDFGDSSSLNFGVYIETATGKSLIKHTLVIESTRDKKQSKLANLTRYSALYPDDINKHRSKFLYQKSNTLSYVHAITNNGYSQLDVSTNSIDFNHNTYDGDSFALTLFDVSYNSDNDAIDFLLLQNTFYSGELNEDRLKIETNAPWVLFNSNNLNNYVEVTGDDSADKSITVINKIDAQFINSNNSVDNDVAYTNTNTPVSKLKLADQNFVVQSELQSNEIAKIFNSCKTNDNEQIMMSSDHYIHIKNNDMALYNLRSSESGTVGESSVIGFDQDNNNYCDSLLFISTLSNEGQNTTLIEAFQITNSGPIKIDSMETARLYAFQQLKIISDVADSSQNIVMFDRSGSSNANSPNTPVSAFSISLSADEKIVKMPLIYGSGLNIELSPNKSHIINLVDTNSDGTDEIIIKHALSANEALLEHHPQSYSLDGDLEVYVIATLNDGVIVPMYVSEFFVQKDKHISIDDKGNVLVGNGLQPFIVTPNKEVKVPSNIEQFTGNNILINNDGSRYQLTGSDLEKYSSNNQLLWAVSNVPTNGSNKYTQLRVLGKYQNTILINYGFHNDLYFINDDTGELILQPRNIKHYSISPDFDDTGLLFLDVTHVEGATGAIQGSGIYQTNDLAGVELVQNWLFSSKYDISRMNISWINVDDDADFEILFRLDKRDGSNEILTADFNGDNQKVLPFTEYMNPTDDLSRSAAWDTKKQGYFSYDTYRSKLTGEVIWQIPVNSFFSDTAYKNGIKQIAVSDNSLYLFETKLGQ